MVHNSPSIKVQQSTAGVHDSNDATSDHFLKMVNTMCGHSLIVHLRNVFHTMYTLYIMLNVRAWIIIGS